MRDTNHFENVIYLHFGVKGASHSILVYIIFVMYTNAVNPAYFLPACLFPAYHRSSYYEFFISLNIVIRKSRPFGRQALVQTIRLLTCFDAASLTSADNLY